MSAREIYKGLIKNRSFKPRNLTINFEMQKSNWLTKPIIITDRDLAEAGKVSFGVYYDPVHEIYDLVEGYQKLMQTVVNCSVCPANKFGRIEVKVEPGVMPTAEEGNKAYTVYFGCRGKSNMMLKAEKQQGKIDDENFPCTGKMKKIVLPPK